nr:hypothetical protein [Tanacetum cinerariifolium]
MKIGVLTSNTPYPSRKIRRICVCISQKTMKKTRSIRPDTAYPLPLDTAYPLLLDMAYPLPLDTAYPTFLSNTSYSFKRLIRRIEHLNYDDYMNEFNDEFEEPWDEYGVPYKIWDHICEPFRFKNGRTKWPTCSSNEDGFCKGGKLPGMTKSLNKNPFMRNHGGEAKQSVINFCGWLKKTFENFHELDYGLLEKLQDYWWKVNKHEFSSFANWRNYIKEPYANYYSNFLDVVEHEDEERCEVFDDHEWPVYYIRRFEMIKYSFMDDE